jgi:hypothetical protein
VLRNYGKYSKDHDLKEEEKLKKMKEIDSIFTSLYKKTTIKDEVRHSDTVKEQLRQSIVNKE